MAITQEAEHNNSTDNFSQELNVIETKQIDVSADIAALKQHQTNLSETRDAKVLLSECSQEFIKEKEYKQIKVAEILNIKQPEVSSLVNGKLNGFSMERLMNFLISFKHHVEIIVQKKGKDVSLVRIDTSNTLETKISLVELVRKSIKERGLIQVDAAEILSIKQPEVSSLMNDKLGGFSMERLMNFLVALKHGINIIVKMKSQDVSPKLNMAINS